MTTEPIIVIQRDGHIERITLNRPASRNALNQEMIDSLTAEIARVEQDQDIRAVILTGAGSTFSAGGDLRMAQTNVSRQAMLDHPRQHVTRFTQHARKMLNVLFCDKPVIAAINGPAMGLGLQIAAACDFRLAVETAKFSDAFVKRGLITASGLFLYPPLIGLAATKRLVFTGMTIDAREAHRIGLVDEVVPPGALEDKASALAAQLAELPPQCISFAKRALNTRLLTEATQFGLTWPYADFWVRYHKDVDEGINAFFEKRPPRFMGF